MAEAQAPSTPGSILAHQLDQAIQAVLNVPLPGARDLPVLAGLKPNGVFTQPQENVLVTALHLLAQSNRIYVYGNSVVQEVRLDVSGLTLSPLRTGTVIETAARKLLSNLLVCEAGKQQFVLPDTFVGMLLLAEPLLAVIPTIYIYVRRPVFDEEFNLRGTGWHAESGILVHGPAIEPMPYQPPAPGLPALQRLPHHLRTLLGGFCFRTDADLANYVGMLLTGLLVNHFISDGKPILLVDGNQPDIGKTLLVRIMGIIFDGQEPSPVRFTNDEEELQKHLCAKLRKVGTSVLFIDNAKTSASTGLSSPTIESQSLAPEPSFRILGQNTELRRPNDFLWAITMNGTKACRDIVSRGIPIQLYFEGETEGRAFNGPDPIEYANQHRLEILGELIGMGVYWTQQGRPLSAKTHRCRHWARIIGGILETAGLHEFLTNLQTAAATFNTTYDELAALIEAIVIHGGPIIIEAPDADTPGADL